MRFFNFFFQALILAFSIVGHLNVVDSWFSLQIAYSVVILVQSQPYLVIHLVTPHLWFSTLGAFAQIKHCTALSRHFLTQSWPT